MFSGFRKSEFQPPNITSHYASLLIRGGRLRPQRGQPPAGRPLPPRPSASPPCPIAVTVSAYAQPAPAPAPSSRFSNLARWRSGGAAVVAWFRLTPTPTASPAHPAMARPSRRLAVRAQGPRPGTGVPRARFLRRRALERPPRGYPAGQVERVGRAVPARRIRWFIVPQGLAPVASNLCLPPSFRFLHRASPLWSAVA